MSIADDGSPVNVPAELESVLRRLRDQFDAPRLAVARPPIQLIGGFWAEMWDVGLSGNDHGLPARVVLRLAPDAAPAAWETALQAGVADQGYPTPTIHASDVDPVPGKRAWSVMGHADGAPLLAGLSGLRALRSLPRLAIGLPDRLAAMAAELHRLDPDPIAAALARIPDRTVGVEGVVDHLLGQARDLDDAPLARTLEQLAISRPTDGPRVVCHGDLHPFNVLADGERSVVLDWTMGQIAHPAYDLGFTHLLVGNPPLHAPRAVKPVLDAAARRIADRFVTTYRRLAPHPIADDTLQWFRTLQGCRILTELAEWRAEGTLAAHRGHPWLSMEPALQPLLAR